MLKLWENSIQNPNPFCPVNEEQLNAFEKANGFTLPADYRHYLLTANGAKPERDCFLIDSPQIAYSDYSISALYAFGGGDDPLEQSWPLANYYDLAEFADDLKPYLVIGDLSGGDLLLVHLETGQVCVFDHEEIDDLPLGAIRIVAKDFSTFIRELMTEETLLAKTNTPDELAEFERRCEEAKRERLEWVRRYKEEHGST